MSLHTEGEKNAPADDTLLADTGPLGEGNASYNFVISASVLAKVLLQRRNAANDATVWQQSIWLGAAQSPFIGPLSTFTYADERLRIVTDGALTIGKIQATIEFPP